ncbi:ribonuclease HII [Brackiella oedipodis]|uniref:ribonuclease HII n=1 Tax=Brackiella oedipodis TaxID=124225 RepID=UPI0009FC16D3|nr:ribonuclease HII [Brackiella oedipodis]
MPVPPLLNRQALVQQWPLFAPLENALIAGIDEAGRGPLAGDVFAAAVVLPLHHDLQGLNDSKKLSEKKRVQLAQQIKEQALAWHIATASVQEIDELNILQAALLAMTRAWQGLTIKGDIVVVDGNQLPRGILSTGQTCYNLVNGDSRLAEIAAASILAKTARDEQMQALHLQYPEYGFDRHKGYGTKQHLQNLQLHGPCIIHRKSFAPVKKYSK